MQAMGPLAGTLTSKPRSQRIALQVMYLATGQYTLAAACVHFFQVSGKDSSSKQKRVIILVDKATFESDLESSLGRIVLISKISKICVHEEHLLELMSPLTKYDRLLQTSSTLDFVRTIPGVFNVRDPANMLPTYELEEGQPIMPKVNCRPSTLTNDRALLTRNAHDEIMKRLRDTHHLELTHLREELQKTKDRQMMEMLDGKTQSEDLRHSLNLAEQTIETLRRDLTDVYTMAPEPLPPPLPSEPPPIPQRSTPARPPVIGYQSGVTTPPTTTILVDKLSNQLNESSRYLDALATNKRRTDRSIGPRRLLTSPQKRTPQRRKVFSPNRSSLYRPSRQHTPPSASRVRSGWK